MKKKILLSFGKKVRQYRIKLNLSQEAFAEKIGLHRTYIGMIERGEKNITLENIAKFSKGLGLTLADLLSDIDT